jgi:hypothetical protein
MGKPPSGGGDRLLPSAATRPLYSHNEVPFAKLIITEKRKKKKELVNHAIAYGRYTQNT